MANALVCDTSVRGLVPPLAAQEGGISTPNTPSCLPVSSDNRRPFLERREVRIAAKAILTGVAVAYSFGPVIAAIVVVVHVIFSVITKDHGNYFWFRPKHAIEQIKDGLKFSPVLFLVNLIFGAVVKFLGDTGPHQIPLCMLLKATYGSPLYFLSLFSRIVLLSPVIEEVIFRGFLQEKLHDIQVILIKNPSEKMKIICQLACVCIQALIFGLIHLHPIQGPSANIFIFAGTFWFACYAGFAKDKNKTLWTSMAIHMSINILVCFRMIFFERIVAPWMPLTLVRS